MKCDPRKVEEPSSRGQCIGRYKPNRSITNQSKNYRIMGDQTNFGRGDTNFGTGVDMYTTVRLTRQAGSDGVDDTDAEGSTLQAVPERQDGVGGLSTLAHKYTNIIPENGRLPIQEVGRKLNADRDLRKLFEDRPRRQA